METEALTREQPNINLAIGPLNVAGQGFQWAEACRRYIETSAFSFATATPRERALRGASHKRILHHRVRPNVLKKLQARRALKDVTHLLAESFTTITGDRRRELLTSDLEWMGRRGVHVGVVFHGSDMRSPSQHLATLKWSYFNFMSRQELSRREASTARNRQRARESGLPLFVSTPDLLSDLPEATWLPLAADLGTWQTDRPALQGGRVRVLHVPSRRVPPIKGTSFIDPVLNALSRRGVVEYLSPHSVPHEEMPALVRSVDVVIDQLLTGSYGVGAIEAMAAGKLVIGNLSSEVRRVVDCAIPILDCSPNELNELMTSIISDPDAYAALAAKGPPFARKLHSGSRSARALHAWLATDQDPMPDDSAPY